MDVGCSDVDCGDGLSVGEEITTDYALDRNLDEIIKIVDITNGKDLDEISESEYKEFIAPFEQVTGNITVGDPQGYRRINILSNKELMSTADTVQVLSLSILD